MICTKERRLEIEKSQVLFGWKRFEEAKKVVMGCSVAIHERRSLWKKNLHKWLILKELNLWNKIHKKSVKKFRNSYLCKSWNSQWSWAKISRNGWMPVWSSVSNIYLKNMLLTKHCRQCPANPNAKARLRGNASVRSFAVFFYIYINKSWLSIHELR